MKRKLIQRNKKKMTFWVKNKICYLLHNDPCFLYLNSRYNYNKVEVPGRAYRRNQFSKMVNVPIEISSTKTRSRIKNLEVASRIFLNIEQFNEFYNIDVKLEELPTRY
jgi:hypothetical protein